MIVGRIDIIKEEGGILYLIHAKETKNKGEVEEKVLLCGDVRSPLLV